MALTVEHIIPVLFITGTGSKSPSKSSKSVAPPDFFSGTMSTGLEGPLPKISRMLAL